MFYNEKIITDATPSVKIYEGNQGQALMKQGQQMKKEADKELEQAKKLEETGYKLNLSQGLNSLYTNPELMSNPQALGQEMDKLAQNVTANIRDDDMKVSVLTDFELAKGSYINKATTNMQRVQAENARSATYDSVYKGIDSLSTSFGNAVSGNYDDNDIVNYQYSLAKIKESVNARNLDGTYMFTDAQRRAMVKDADSAVVGGFIDTYSKLPEAQRMAIASKLENDYFRISLGDDGFKYQGNIDLASRPVYRNEDGSVSTEVSRTFEFDGKHVILPTIKTVNGRRVNMTDAEAVEEFRSSGLHLGVYNSKAEAEKAAEAIHNRGEKGVDLKDIVGETGYNDIKRAVAKYDSALKAEQIKQFNLERRYAAMEFSKNPTESGFKRLESLYPEMSDTTRKKYIEAYEQNLDYETETIFEGAKEAESAAKEFMNVIEGTGEDNAVILDDLAEYIRKLQRSNLNKKISTKEVEKFSNLAYNAINDKVFATQVNRIFGEDSAFDKVARWFLPQRDMQRVEQIGGQTIQATVSYMLNGDFEGAREVYKKGQREAIKIRYPEIPFDSLQEGEIFWYGPTKQAFKFLGFGLDDVLIEVDASTGAVK